MGCKCKDSNKTPLNLIDKENGNLNIKGKIMKIPLTIILTIGMLIFSPFLLIFIWVVALKSIFGDKVNIVNMMLGKFKSSVSENEITELNEVSESNVT